VLAVEIRHFRPPRGTRPFTVAMVTTVATVATDTTDATVATQRGLKTKNTALGDQLTTGLRGKVGVARTVCT
jgi:hypothetical protein